MTKKPAKKTSQTETPLVCVNLPEADAERDPHTRKELVRTIKNDRASRIANEFDRGLKFIKKYPKSVTFYGSARFKADNPHYRDACDLSAKLSKAGYTIVTGGGAGIMEAANKGAKEAGGPSIGLNIELPREQILNPYVTDSLSFYYFFSRKTTLSFSSEAYIFYPGGFGTLDEFFEIVTLIQTRKIRIVPVILVGGDFWKPLESFLEDQCLRRHATVNRRELGLYVITDNHDEIVDIVTNAPVRD
ncbi:MAG: Rossman fold protein, TIGR00730 family [Candidatus Lloydbacteria bacterium RIFCSPHIGHO2_02_FULL_54_17]|uniref:Cytokinin riboside 5'-monophosphate phosphoribohydrolase n=1 Tax=Candidatus Lloydbacteria bacterium RIFCSPHIGHO2_02_FULL_54_17 TaxID=1798664 RepID=A0A1G2DDX1_9BACT|nr:MAG: Rossman fold protein, TIGR00730 family [Candidatus Lloydbacteria bacterium RIFCSPHIGHO2_01_FULL_54_11]OGZ11835.1 MAG: Rossman fold protein, TIGR00730 family [Candidatus Lloydbacteria bacterium RIFCSPHIGHO2_02_FULL_54_17]OGZ14143.1 MAG: Rossman fold protein, TIGR00730 family [Candidatus Lloydbacteria bacterium RIFCSPLOWO2_01_FULL_54_18]